MKIYSGLIILGVALLSLAMGEVIRPTTGSAHFVFNPMLMLSGVFLLTVGVVLGLFAIRDAAYRTAGTWRMTFYNADPDVPTVARVTRLAEDQRLSFRNNPAPQ